MFSGLFVLITHSPPHERHISHGYPAPTWIGLPTPFWVIPQDEQNITFLSSSRVSNSLPFPVSLVGNSTSTFCPSKNAECFVYFFKRSASYSGTFKVSSCNSRKKTKSVQFSSSALEPQHFCSPWHMMGCNINIRAACTSPLPLSLLILQGCTHLNLGTITLPQSHTLELPPSCLFC